jgi:hypothetical protein
LEHSSEVQASRSDASQLARFLSTYFLGPMINRPNMVGGKTYDRFMVYLPADVARDSGFPFKTENPIRVMVDLSAKRVILEKAHT